MAHTNQTPNYGLSEFVGTDKPAWLVDYNGDMEKIDLGMKAAQDVADAAKEEADQGAIDIAAITITANSADAKASAALSNLADTYDATSTYAVGEIVIYQNITYKCNTTISVPEPFTGAHWDRITIEELISSINSNLNQVTSNLNSIIANNIVHFKDYTVSFTGAEGLIDMSSDQILAVRVLNVLHDRTSGTGYTIQIIPAAQATPGNPYRLTIVRQRWNSGTPEGVTTSESINVRVMYY